ncbi:MAG: hypothetical protein ACLFUV_05435 [Methanomassiliicoccales archaeon]
MEWYYRLPISATCFLTALLLFVMEASGIVQFFLWIFAAILGGLGIGALFFNDDAPANAST